MRVIRQRSLAGGPSNDFLPGRLPNAQGYFFMFPVVALIEVQATKWTLFLYCSVILFCLFWGKQRVMNLYITY